MQISVIHPINKLKDKRLLIKDKNHMIISIDLEKSFHKIQYPFMLKKKKKISPENEREGTYLNITRATYNKPTANIISNGEKLKAFPLRSGTRKRAHSHHCYST